MRQIVAILTIIKVKNICSKSKYISNAGKNLLFWIKIGKMTAAATKYLSLSEYFDFESTSKIRYEYVDGKLRPMSYTSSNHGRIVRNISRVVDTYFLDKNGEIWTETRMLYVPDCNRVYYPDGLIVLGKSEYYKYKSKMEATLNPAVLFETASDSTEENDKNEKWQCYQTIPSLKQYLLISQKSIFVELYEKQEGSTDTWIYKSYRNLNDVIQIAECTVILKDIYNKVEFPQVETK